MKNYHDLYLSYKNAVNKKISESIKLKEPEELYAPVNYILSAGGKRIRPMMLIFSCEAAGGVMSDALDAAAAIEILHNFTLVHDDIMDNADTRRGRETIHKKWNTNVAILAGDHLIGMAYKFLLNTKSENLAQISKAFTEGIIEVCEGQSYDKEFESRTDVTIDEYMMMIKKKTAAMLQACAVIGGLIANGNENAINDLENYALNLGLAFQIQDDLLDITGDESEFGKLIGGDIIEGKKTYLLLRALEAVDNADDRKFLGEIISKNAAGEDQKKVIAKVKDIYERYGVIRSALEKVTYFTAEAEKHLSFITDPENRDKLLWLSQMLLSRNF